MALFKALACLQSDDPSSEQQLRALLALAEQRAQKLSSVRSAVPQARQQKRPSSALGGLDAVPKRPKLAAHSSAPGSVTGSLVPLGGPRRPSMIKPRKR
jgi:hypothetical protein